MLLDLENRHRFSVLPVLDGESPPQEYTLHHGMLWPVLRRRRQLRKAERQAERLARAFAALDDVARERRRVPPRRTLRAGLSGSR
jgi:hypothetical protein